MSLEYLSVDGEASATISVKRSEFIGRLRRVSDEEEARAFIAEVKAENRDARHNVFAYRLKQGGKKRCSDDGEPQGTAGQPVLGVLEMAEIYDCCLVVSRYFGGILLGAGGLVRAYSKAASETLEKAEIVTLRPFKKCSLCCGYSSYDKLSALIRVCGGKIETADFGESVCVKFLLPLSAFSDFCERLREQSLGAAELSVSKEESFESC